MPQLCLQVTLLIRYARYFAYYVLVLLVLPHKLTIRMCIISIKADIKPVVYIRFCVHATRKVTGTNPHVIDLYTYQFLKSFSIV